MAGVGRSVLRGALGFIDHHHQRRQLQFRERLGQRHEQLQPGRLRRRHQQVRQAAQPSYQSGVVTQSTTKRTVPDVAFDADPNSGVPVYDTYDNGSSTPWEQVGGTSLAAPMWAGVIALADQGRVQNNLGTLDGRTQTSLVMVSVVPPTPSTLGEEAG